MLYIGIDPGHSSGAVAFLESDPYYGDKVLHLHVENCPETMAGMYRLLKHSANRFTSLSGGCFALIERVHALPQNAVRSAFKFGVNYGAWLMALAALSIPHEEITPGTWMKEYGSLPKDRRDRKHRLKELAEQRFPNSAEITLRNTDAVLIANVAKALRV